MSTPATITQTRAFAALADQTRDTDRPWIRVQRIDGTVLEGMLIGMEPLQLTILDPANLIQATVPAGEVAALAVRGPHRAREWMLAGAAIIGATVALVGYASLPWVRPGKGDVTSGFMALYAAAGALFPMLLARTRLGRWLKRWQVIYPP